MPWIGRVFSIYFDFSQAIPPFYLIVPVLYTSGRHHLKGKGRGAGGPVIKKKKKHYSALLPSVPPMTVKGEIWANESNT